MAVNYDSAFWNQLQEDMPTLQMDDAFASASKNIKANYHPVYWGAANTALEKEGLHYEYQSAYWDEARNLLDKADRRVFFTKWTGVAAVLLLISFLGIGINITGVYTNTHRAGHGNNDQSLMHTQNMTAANLDSNVDMAESLLVEANEENGIDESQDINNEQAFQNEVVNESIVENVQTTDENGNGVVQDESNTIEELITELPNPLQSPIMESPSVENDLTENTVDQNEVDEHLVDETLSMDAVMAEMNDNSDLNRLNSSVKPIALGELTGPEQTLLEISGRKLKQNHAFALIGGAGFGNSYGSEGFVRTKRNYLGAEYLTKGFGKLRRFEFGASVVVTHMKHDDLKQDLFSAFRDTTGFFNSNENIQWSDQYFSGIKITDMIYVNSSVHVNYRLNKRNKVKFGVGVDTYITTQNNVRRRVNDFSLISNNEFERYEGFRGNDLRFSLGYEFQLTPRFGLQLNSNFGLFDRTEDQFDGGLFNDKEKSLTLGLKYNIFRVAE